MNDTEFDGFWSDRSRWKWGCFYVCADDPRVIVPKHPKWAGRTLNFAHRAAYLVLVLTLLATLAPPLVAAATGHIESPAWMVALALVLMGIVLVYYRTDLRGLSCRPKSGGAMRIAVLALALAPWASAQVVCRF